MLKAWTGYATAICTRPRSRPRGVKRFPAGYAPGPARRLEFRETFLEGADALAQFGDHAGSSQVCAAFHEGLAGKPV